MITETACKHAHTLLSTSRTLLGTEQHLWWSLKFDALLSVSVLLHLKNFNETKSLVRIQFQNIRVKLFFSLLTVMIYTHYNYQEGLVFLRKASSVAQRMLL